MDDLPDVTWDDCRRMLIDARLRAGMSEEELAVRVGWQSGDVVRGFEAGDLLPDAEHLRGLLLTLIGPE
jgi:ribosome-binding protein aMBF1 (putative translation factor)